MEEGRWRPSRLRRAVVWGRMPSRAAATAVGPGDEPRRGGVRELGRSSAREGSEGRHLQLSAARWHGAAPQPLRAGKAAAGRRGGGSLPPAGASRRAPGPRGGSGTQRRARVAEGRFEEGTARRGGEPRCRHEGAGARREDGVRHLGRAGGLGVVGQRLPLRGARGRGEPAAAARPCAERGPFAAGGRPGRRRRGAERERGGGGGGRGGRGGGAAAAEGPAPRSGGWRGRPGGGRGWASCLARERAGVAGQQLRRPGRRCRRPGRPPGSFSWRGFRCSWAAAVYN